MLDFARRHWIAPVAIAAIATIAAIAIYEATAEPAEPANDQPAEPANDQAAENEDLILRLRAAARNAIAAMPWYGATVEDMEDADEDEPRFITMMIESCVLDLIQCLESTANKREKRTRRAEFLLRIFDSEISHETKDRFYRVLATFVDTEEEDVEEEAEDEDMLNETEISALRACTARDGDMSEGLIFKKFSSTEPFKVPITQKFHDICKTNLNSNGFVYDIFTNIAVISFKELTVGALTDVESSKLRRSLLSTATLIFKGGASMGKFLFMADEDLWDSLSDEDRQFVRDNFVNGGDNDTSISFHTLPTDEWSCEQINQEIGAILYDMEGVVLRNVVEYGVEEIIKEHLEAAAEGVMEFAGKQFSFSQRQASSFAIVEKDETHVECLSLDSSKQALFGSISYLEFNDQNGEKVKFYLGRIKGGFVAKMENEVPDVEGLAFNCYAECLDISACCVDSASPFDAKYQGVDFSSFI